MEKNNLEHMVEIGSSRWHRSIGDEGQDVLVAQFQIDEEEVLAAFPSEKLYDLVINEDTDLYLPTSNLDGTLTEDDVAFKFRKGTFTKEEQEGCYDGLYEAAQKSNNRGNAAGPVLGEDEGFRLWVQDYHEAVFKWFQEGQPASLDGTDPLETLAIKYPDNGLVRGKAYIRYTIEEDFGKDEETYQNIFEVLVEKMKGMSIQEAQEYATFAEEKYISVTTYAGGIWSGIAGFYDRYPRIPFGRPTAYTEKNPEQFAKCYPFARKLDSEFARLLPLRYGRQKKLADNTDKRYLIGEDTTFTTITVNTTTNTRNARMACHRDAGSLNEGFSNLTVVTKDGKDWKGGYLVCPEVRVAINVRPGDLLLIDNMRIIHGNTPIEAPDSGEENTMRMSLIFYYREAMKTLGSWDYENIRRQYVTDRMNDKEHSLWWKKWNGVSPNMWFEREWYDYLEHNMGKEALKEYHPEAGNQSGSLEDFF